MGIQKYNNAQLFSSRHQIIPIRTKMNSLLRQFRVAASASTSDASGRSSAKYHTHVSMIHPHGKFVLSEQNMDTFWDCYGHQYTAQPLGIAERTGHMIPVLVDVDIKKEITDDPEWRSEAVSLIDRFSNVGETVVHLHELRNWSTTSLYTMEFVDRLTEIYQKVLADILDESTPTEDLACVLLTKPASITLKGSRAFLKHGFHLHFPMIYLPRGIQEHEVLERVRLELKRINHNIPLPSGVKTEDLVDRSTYRGESSSWLLYGSRKADNMDTYLVHSVHTPQRKRIQDWRRYFLHDIRSTEDDTVGYHLFLEGNGEPLSLTEENLDIMLPRILSTRPQGRSDRYMRSLRPSLVPIREILQIHAPKTFTSGSASGSGTGSGSGSGSATNKLMDHQDTLLCMTSPDTSEDATEKHVLELLALLSSQRAVDRNDWIHVGWTLYNIMDGSDRALEIWLDFSRLAGDKFDPDSCRYEWKTMKKKGLTIGTLKYMAKRDNPHGYSLLMARYTKDYMDKSTQLGGSHHDLSLALFQKYDNEFVCASTADKLWYRFVSPTWIRDEEGVSLSRLITSELVPDYERIGKDLFAKQVNADNEESKMYSKKVELITRQIRNLKSAPFKSHVMKECREVFYDREFYHQLDQDAFLIAFHNGVYDLHSHTFREGRPSDRLSLKMPIQFRTDLYPTHPDVQLVHDFFLKIFPDASVREYFFNVTCDIFIGGNIQKIVQVWSGGGNNGKSVTQRLFEKMLGPYSIKLPTSLLVGKRTQSSSACPELARAGHGVRLAMLQEPDGSDVINVGILKELSGNDTFFARGLYKEGSEITPMFKLVLVCNEPPKVPNNDKAAWNRIRVIPFESTFSDNAPETLEEQLLQKHFPKDRYFETTTLPSMIEPFAWVLIEHLKRRPMVYPEPPKVMLATSTYQRQNDVYGQYVEENIIKVEDPVEARKAHIRLVDLYTHFKEWYRDSNPQGSLPSKSEVKEYLIKAWGPPSNSTGPPRWTGYVLRPPSAASEVLMNASGSQGMFEE